MAKRRVFKTRIDLAAGTREKAIALLNQSIRRVEALATRYAGLAATMRAAIDAAAEHADMDTADLFTDVSHGSPWAPRDDPAYDLAVAREMEELYAELKPGMPK